MRWVIFSLALIVGAAQSEEKPPSKEVSKAGAKQPGKQQIGTISRPLVITVLPTEEDQKEAQARADERKDKKQSETDLVWWTRVLGILAGLQCLALIGHAIIFRSQAKALHDTIKETAKTTKTMQASEQAVIYASPGGGYKADGNQFIGMIMNLGNCGKTVAHLEKVVYGAIQFDGSDPWKMPNHFPRTVVMRHIVPANQPPIPARLPFDFNIDRIAFYGRVHFRDVFGKKWYTTWAYRLERSEGWAAYPFDPNAQLHPDGAKD